VGAHLARLLVASGADVKVADVNAERVGALAVEIGAVPVAVEDAIAEPCDIYAPCALGGALTIESIERLRCRAVVGAANNQLLSADVDDALSELGVLYAPDFVVNAGGIINLAQEFTGYSRDLAIAATSRIEQTLITVFELAEDRAIAPGRAAELMAREWIESNAVPGGRWEPGQPTAWTNGEPLRSVRPER
jgi:glutamate dehydrogenase/leucine dehydrogenase